VRRKNDTKEEVKQLQSRWEEWSGEYMHTPRRVEEGKRRESGQRRELETSRQKLSDVCIALIYLSI
jgi:hypothetical protein